MLSVSDNQWVILAMIMVFLLMAGMVLDGISIYLIMLPLLMPIVAAFQWNVTWFGVVMAMNIAIGQFTPPVAVNLMVTTAVADVPMESTFRWILWLILSMTLALIAVLVWPELVLAIPRALGYQV